MSFTAPYTYIDGDTLDAVNQNSNDFAAKTWINSGIVQSDLAYEIITSEMIVSPEIEIITASARFMTGEVWGWIVDKEVINRSYFTSHIKSGAQHSVAPEVYIPIAEAGQKITTKVISDVMIQMSASITSSENDVQDNGKWDSKIILRYKSSESAIWTYIEGCRAYSFEETSVAAAGAHDPTDVTAFTAAAGYPTGTDAELCLKRWYQVAWIIQDLPAGSWIIQAAINSKVESGFVSARSFIVEVLY